MLINFQKIVILGILIIMTARMLYLFIKSHVYIDAEMGFKTLYAMLYLAMAVFSIVFYYGKDFSKSNNCITFSYWKDFVFIAMICIPIMLTMRDCVKKLKQNNK